MLVFSYLGQRNIVYILFAATVWQCTGCYDWFLLTTSFVHYIRYIATYYYRQDVDFGSFKRDVLLFKSIALIQIFFYYLFPDNAKFEVDVTSLAMIITGYGVSLAATEALGLDRTYFGVELGKCKSKWISKFPYGLVFKTQSTTISLTIFCVCVDIFLIL